MNRQEFFDDLFKISIRGSYKSVSETDRDRLLDAHKTGNDFLAVAKVLGINGTAYNIVKTGREFKLAKGGAIARKIDNEIVSKAVEFFEENPLLTLKQLNSLLRAHLLEKPIFTKQTLSRALEGQLNTVKIARDCPANSSSTIDARYKISQWLMSEDMVNARKIYIGEYGCNIHNRRTQRLANVGQRAFRNVLGQRGANITVCCAVSTRGGLRHYQILQGGMKQHLFQFFYFPPIFHMGKENI